ncbi:hypothetical protein LMG22037_05790 [Paraburkholderia phenoliruptrix]|uniref:Uncharacterized protein n=1 Tax=Paraburkholderia phenoliruptrix TaxID=252970 RepID=A0A6J5CDH4_9BURK|nr:hypothetical protein [Paraburkholderia phenoliruptrix]CAB3733349.1 hypothetical protein LMG22037_05790 [Paraburkholderia phenoliruptrix]
MMVESGTETKGFASGDRIFFLITESQTDRVEVWIGASHEDVMGALEAVGQTALRIVNLTELEGWMEKAVASILHHKAQALPAGTVSSMSDLIREGMSGYFVAFGEHVKGAGDVALGKAAGEADRGRVVGKMLAAGRTLTLVVPFDILSVTMQRMLAVKSGNADPDYLVCR